MAYYHGDEGKETSSQTTTQNIIPQGTLRAYIEKQNKARKVIETFTPGRTLATGLAGVFNLGKIKQTENYIQNSQRETLSLYKQAIQEAQTQGDTETVDRIKNKMLSIGDGITLTEQIAKELPSDRAVIASAAELALFAATAYKSGLTSFKFPTTAQLSTIRQAKLAQQSIDAGIKSLVKSGLVSKTAYRMAQSVKFLESAAKEGLIGSAFFASIRAQEDNATTDDIVKAAEMGALFGAGTVGAFAGLAKTFEYGGKKFTQATKYFDKLANKYSSKNAGKTATTDVVSEVLGTIGEKKRTTPQIAADTYLKTVQQIRQFKQKFIDRGDPIKMIEDLLYETKGAPLTDEERVYRNWRLVNSQADQKAEALVVKLSDDLLKYNDIRNEYNSYLALLDYIDRAKLGNMTPMGKDVGVLNDKLIAMSEQLGADTMIRLGEVRQIISKYNLDDLAEKLDAGIINRTQLENLVKEHPNYIPHDVIMEVEEQSLNRLSSSFNVSKTDLMKAVGSVKNIQNPLEAIMQRTVLSKRVIEYNKWLRDLTNLQKQYGLVEGMTVLRSAENVERRFDVLSQLKTLRSELKAKSKVLSKEKKFSGKVQTEINKLEKELDLLDKEFSDEFGKFFKQGEGYTKIVSTKATTKTIPFELSEAENIARKAKTLDEFSSDKTITKLFESGKFERFGFKSLDSFYKTVKEPFKEGVIKESEKIIKGSAEKLSTITKESEQLQTLLERTQSLSKTSADDAVMVAQDAVKIVQEQRKTLVEELKTLSQKYKPDEMGTINLYNNGIREIWAVPKDIEAVVKGTGSWLPQGIIGKVLLGAQKLMKQGATTLNPAFALQNFARDKQTALFADAFIQEIAKYSGTSQKLVNLTKDEIVKLYETSGTFGSSIFREGEDEIFKMLQEKGLNTGSFKNEFNPLELTKKLNESIEQSTRFQVFERAIRAGLSPKDAALVSRDATVDFAKMGTWMESANRAIPFLNARVQGLVNIGRTFKYNPELFARIQLYTAVYPTMLLHSHNRRFQSYQNISQDIKNRYWVIMTGETEAYDSYSGNKIIVPQFISVVKGEAQSLVANPVQWYLDRADGVNYQGVSEMLASTLNNASPLAFQSYNSTGFWATFLSQLGPVANIPIGLASNQNLFYGKPIVPEDRLNAKPEVQVQKSTPRTTRMLAGLMNVSPARLEFVLNSFGGLPQDVQDAADIVFGLYKGDMKESLQERSVSGTEFGALTQVPALRRFVREASEFYSPKSEFQKKQLQEIERDYNSQSLNTRDEANKIIEKVNRFETKNEKLEYLASLTPVFKGNKELSDKVKTGLKTRSTFEVLNKNTPVKVRAAYLLQQVTQMQQDNVSRTEINNYLLEAKKAGIYTSDVARAIRIIQRQAVQE